MNITVNTADISITDDVNDVASKMITLGNADVEIGESETGATTVRVTATLSGSVQRGVDTVIDLASALGGGAAGGVDYTLAGTCQIAW